MKCPDCHSSYIIENGICSCRCGTFPISIILSDLAVKSPLIATELSRFARYHPIFDYQHRIHAILKYLSERSGDYGLLHGVRKLPPEVQSLTLVYGDAEKIQQALTSGEITSKIFSQRFYIIPETIENIVTGLICIHHWSRIPVVLRWMKGGVGLGFSLYCGKYFSDYVYVFQNPFLAINYFVGIHNKELFIPPLIISPDMDFHESVKLFPRRKFVCILSNFAPEKYRHLKSLDVRIVAESAVNNIQYDTTELLLYLNYSKPISEFLLPSVALSANKSIVAKPTSWYFLPSSELALNVGLEIDRVYKRKTAYNYCGKIKTIARTLRFRVKAKQDFYETVKNTCEEAGITFFCAPSIKKSLADLAVALSPDVNTKSYRCYIGKSKIVLPNIVIKKDKIIKTELGIPGEEAYNIRPYKYTDLYGKSLGEFNQILMLFGICYALFRQIYMRQSINIYVLNPWCEVLTQFCNDLSIPVLPAKAFYYKKWPGAYPEFRLETLRTESIKIYSVDEMRAILAAYFSKGLLLGITPTFEPRYEDRRIQGVVCRWLQLCLQKIKTIDRCRNAQYGDLCLDWFAKEFNLTEEAKKYIKMNLKSVVRKPKDSILDPLVMQLVYEGALDKTDLMWIGSKKFKIEVPKINEALRRMDLPPILPGRDGDTVVITLESWSRTPMSLFSSTLLY